MSQYQYTNTGETREIADDLMAAWLAACNPKANGWAPYTPPPPQPEVPQVPDAVTMRQARLALLGAGVLSQVDAAINAMSEPQKAAAKITWEYSTEVQRHNGLVSQMAPALGLTEAQIDALFLAAAQL